MMIEGKDELVCARKRGRDEDDDQPDQQQKQMHCRADFLQSDLSTCESTDIEDEFVCIVDEERVCNLMRELMEEIGIVAHHPPLNLPLEYCSPEIGYALCDSALSSTSCSSKSADDCDSHLFTESVKSVVDCGDLERAKGFGDYYGEEYLTEVFGTAGFISNFDGTFLGDQLCEVDDVVSSEMSFNGEDNDFCEIKNWVLA